jgi:hypothetical protein
MASNVQKTPLGLSLNRFARTKALDQIQISGLSLPCSVVSVRGQVVQVAFQVIAAPGQAAVTLPNVTIPVATSFYDWVPFRPGDLGVAVSADAYLGGISGLGGGVASMSRPGNLTALVFLPVANVGWTVPDATQRVVQGAGGVLLRTLDGVCSIDITPTGIAITVPAGRQVAINGNGGSIAISDATVSVTSGDVVADGISLKTHVHGGVQPGGGDTGPPV